MSIGCDLERIGDGYAILAPAKINLYLAVGGLRDDGYHEIDTVMVTVGLCDRLLVQPAATIRLRTAGDQPVVADPNNLCFRAARELLAVIGRRDDKVGACITLDKRIPVQAGLGGGSADAAATLIALNALWGLGLSLADLAVVAGRLGSDVPFCVRGGVARASGRGERLTPLAAELPLWFTVAVPDGTVDTGLAYGWLDRSRDGRPAAGPPPEMLAALAGQPDLIAELLHNDFESVVPDRVPGTGRLLHAFATAGMPAVLSGSGSAVVGVTADPRQAAAVTSALSPHVRGVWAVPAARARIDGPQE